MTATTNDGLHKVEPACPRPCSVCPWRLSNQGVKHAHDFYTKSNLARLWRGLRAGARMSCHETDPRMAEFEGYEALVDREVTHECAGALVLVQREWMLFQGMCEADPKGKRTLQQYRRARPNGLVREGLIALMERAMLGGSVLNPVAMSLPNLGDEEIGYLAIARGAK